MADERKSNIVADRISKMQDVIDGNKVVRRIAMARLKYVKGRTYITSTYDKNKRATTALYTRFPPDQYWQARINDNKDVAYLGKTQQDVAYYMSKHHHNFDMACKDVRYDVIVRGIQFEEVLDVWIDAINIVWKGYVASMRWGNAVPENGRDGGDRTGRGWGRGANNIGVVGKFDVLCGYVQYNNNSHSNYRGTRPLYVSEDGKEFIRMNASNICRNRNRINGQRGYFDVKVKGDKAYAGTSNCDRIYDLDYIAFKDKLEDRKRYYNIAKYDTSKVMFLASYFKQSK
mmetsp:Transcript_66024/g.59289  ORF Transcript_66024/g.59289 Transcript_66024/m.59289 type:complete len:287 (-) Transcript_66024:128-988(-)